MSLIQLHKNDNVLVAKTPLAIGQEAAGFGIRVKAQVPAGHKIALRDIAQGERILKYDTEIGEHRSSCRRIHLLCRPGLHAGEE